MKLRAGIIGCGRIGSLWDENVKDVLQAQPKTHALAFYQNAATQLVAVCDSDLQRAQTAAQVWHCGFFTDSVSAFLKEKLDIISVCVPVSERKALLTEITKLSPESSLLIEKPLAENQTTALEIRTLLKNHKGQIAVNYSRRFAPGIRQLKNEIASGEWGELQRGFGYYGNGLLNNGSHMIDLMMFLLGSPNSFGRGKTVEDGRTEDPTLDAIFDFNGAQVLLQGLDHRDYTIFELDLFFRAGRIRLKDRGFKIEIQRIIPDTEYAGFKIPGPSIEIDSGLGNSLAAAISELSNPSSQPSCSLDDAILVNEIVAKIRSSDERS